MTINRSLVVMTASTVANAATIFSTSFNGTFSSGLYAAGSRAVLITLAGSSNVTITEQASVDGTTFYDAVDQAGVALGVVLTAGTSTTGTYITYNPVMAIHNRFKIVAGAASTVSITLTIRE